MALSGYINNEIIHVWTWHWRSQLWDIITLYFIIRESCQTQTGRVQTNSVIGLFIYLFISRTYMYDPVLFILKLSVGINSLHDQLNLWCTFPKNINLTNSENFWWLWLSQRELLWEILQHMLPWQLSHSHSVRHVLNFHNPRSFNAFSQNGLGLPSRAPHLPQYILSSSKGKN